MVETEEQTTQPVQNDQPEAQAEEPVADERDEIMNSAKEAIMKRITSSEYDFELKSSLIAVTQDHFDSFEAIQQQTPSDNASITPNVYITPLIDRLWGAFANYKEYMANKNKPLDEKVEPDFRTRFISGVVEIMLNAGKNSQVSQIEKNYSKKTIPAESTF